MLKIYFGEWGSGKLQRLPYLGYYILLMVLVMLIIVGGIFAVGAGESIMGGNIAATEDLLMAKFGAVALFGIVVIMFLAMLGQLNILGKRIRDMGLPALWTILGIIAISLILNVIFPPQEAAISAAAVHTAEGSATTVAASTTTTSMVVQAYDIIVFLCLLLIPSNTFKNKNHY